MIYFTFHYIESINRTIVNSIILFYYKVKYGKRLKIGKGIKFRKRFIINIASNGFLEIGDNNFFNNDCSINCHKKIIIGDNNLFGEGVKIYDHNHVFNKKNMDIKTNFTSNDITIGNRNWFGSNVVLLRKTNIGNNCVVGASVVLNERVNSNSLIKNPKPIIEEIIYK